VVGLRGVRIGEAMNTLNTEFAVIDAEHHIRTRMSDELALLRILLRQARGQQRTPVMDTFLVQQILQRHPDFSATYGVSIRSTL
jgi:hypothetical protein